MISQNNCKNLQQTAAVAHQIARAATLYGVTEIIVYNTDISTGAAEEKQQTKANEDAQLLLELLRYFVTPSYLRKSVLDSKIEEKIDRVAKKLPKLSRLPFLNHSEKYLQGYSVKKTATTNKSQKKRKSKAQIKEEKLTNLINIGEKQLMVLSNGVKVPIDTLVLVDKSKQSVVTVQEAFDLARNRKLKGEEPFWSPDGFGYRVRLASKFGQVFTECPFTDGYKFTAWAPCGGAEETESQAQEQAEALNSISVVNESSNDGFFKVGVPQADPKEDVPLLLVYGEWHELSATILFDKDNFEGLPEPQVLFDGRIKALRARQFEDAVLMGLAKVDGL